MKIASPRPSGQTLEGPGDFASCAPRPWAPGAGCAERQGHRADRGRVCFLSGDFSARPGHCCAVPSSERRAGTEPSRRPPARPGCPSPRLGQTSWACSVCKPIINAICRNENIPLKCVFEQVLEKTRREREHLWWRDASKCPGPVLKAFIVSKIPTGELGCGRVCF